MSDVAETEDGANALRGRLLLPARTIAAGLKEAFVCAAAPVHLVALLVPAALTRAVLVAAALPAPAAARAVLLAIVSAA